MMLSLNKSAQPYLIISILRQREETLDGFLLKVTWKSVVQPDLPLLSYHPSLVILYFMFD